MLGFLTIEVHGADMDSASRHAQRLANNFLEDLDDMQRASRARDRRAMSHFETGVQSIHISSMPTVVSTVRERRSPSRSSMRSHMSSPPAGYHQHFTRSHYPQTRVIPQRVPSIMMVGKSLYPVPSRSNSAYFPSRVPSSYVYTVPGSAEANRAQYWYDRIVENPTAALPTSNLRAHPPPRRNFSAPEEQFPRIVRSTVSRRRPIASSRLGSVPPSPVGGYRPLYYSTDVDTSSVYPRTYYKTNRYITETPYYLSSYTGRTVAPVLTTQYSTTTTPVYKRYSYYYPPVITGTSYHSPLRTTSYTNLLPELQHERRRIERRMDDLLDYKLPPPEYYREMRGSLRGLQDKLDTHRRMLDRYSGIDMNTAPSSVEDRIESKYQQLASRVTARG
ncbi:unnamed protein product [Dicrocoelium dendriticum]|nr:unnamed protein product [Dicrocoelium dendriticum]